MEFEYFRVEDSEQFSFYRIPKALFTEKEFGGLSTDAKLLYGILLDRISLSRKNGWVDAEGYVYIVYTITELEEMLHLSHATVIKLFHELDTEHGIGLIERRQVGCNRPAVIYVKNFVKPFPAGLDENESSGIQNNRSPAFKNLEARPSKNWKSGLQKIRSPGFKNFEPNNTDINNTEKNDTEESEGESPPAEEPDTCYGRFGNVKLSPEEYRELEILYPQDFQLLIDQLSAYMASSGRTYQNYFATLVLWAQREGKKPESGQYDFEEGECL